MPEPTAYQKYQEQTVNTATPGMLIIMLFEGAVKNISAAIKAIEEKNIETAHNSIIKAETIYTSLIGFLNGDAAMSEDLRKIYTFLLERLIEANTKKDASILKEVLEFSLEFRYTWRQAEKNLHIQRNKA